MMQETSQGTNGKEKINQMDVALLEGDMSKLSPHERVTHYFRVCESLELNPLTRPFEYIRLNNKLTLYATKSCTEQLRSIRGISITNLEAKTGNDLHIVIASAINKEGRTDAATGAVSTHGLKGEGLANALMKAETKAKRRVTLSLAGLGWVDESEIGSIPNAQTVIVNSDGVIEGEERLKLKHEEEIAKVVQKINEIATLEELKVYWPQVNEMIKEWKKTNNMVVEIMENAKNKRKRELEQETKHEEGKQRMAENALKNQEEVEVSIDKPLL